MSVTMEPSEVSIKISQDITLKGLLKIPDKAKTLVIFAHGSGSGRHSPRNQYVAEVLTEWNLGTLLLDLLTEKEEAVDEVTREFRFDIELLAERLIDTSNWAADQKNLKNLKIAYFGSSTGAAAALIAAAKQGNAISSIVSRGGRPDLGGSFLPLVKSPTLLLVGGNDYGVIELNEEAYKLLSCEKKLKIIPYATHLFEEPGTLEEVATLAAEWFKTH